jgi:hypothetical protein
LPPCPGAALPLCLLVACCLTAGEGRPARAAAFVPVDRDANGVEDLLDDWGAGRVGWAELVARACADQEDPAAKLGRWPAGVAEPGPGPLARGELRLLRLGGNAEGVAAAAVGARAAGGVVQVLHRLSRFGGVEALAVDPVGLRALLAAPRSGRLVLDRDGTPALDRSSVLCGVSLARAGPWRVEGDWTASVAILDSGCDTAHDDLGDFSHDNRDGPPPLVGDALDWSSAAFGWPLFLEYKVVGWHDVTDDFPLAAGPWDYHWHGTALAGVVAGAGELDARYRGLAPSGRLTIVKFYDFDGVWRQWQGDFLAACAWLLDHRAQSRVRVALCAVNWDVDLGLGAAMDELRAAGILVVAAMGNGGVVVPPGYPARLPSVVGVGAVNDAGELAGTSGHGLLAGAKPDLVAPGGGVLPTAGGIGTADNEPDDSTSERRGTSLAAAHVAAGAFLVLEALRKEGWPDEGAVAGDLVSALLRGTAAPVLVSETPDGAARLALAPWLAVPDSVRGWGLLQVPAAIEALLAPLPGGGSAVDSLGGVGGRRTVARRVSLLPGRECLVQATPSVGLDVVLEIHDIGRLCDPAEGLSAIRVDAAGAGGWEQSSFRTPDQGFCFVAVKRLSGTGRVTITLTDPAESADPAWSATLGGGLAGWPVAGVLGATGQPTLICTGAATIDPQARLVHALDGAGRERAGWPVSIFLPTSLQGPLTAPLVWNLDAAPGDEIAVASAFGKLYLLSVSGSYVVVDAAAANVPLTAPVGRERVDGGREVVVVSATGILTRVAPAGAIVATLALGGTAPLPPAVGQLDAEPGEEFVVAFPDGRVTAAGESGLLPGWPVTLAVPGLRAPVLADRDGDGRHEIVLTHLAGPAQRDVVFRVLRGNGVAAAGDGAVAPAPDGGRWLSLSDPAVYCETAGGGPRVVIQGLYVTGSMPDSLRWRLASICLTADGVASATPLAGLLVKGLTPVGNLQSRWIVLPAPLAWNFTGSFGPEPQFLAGLGWEEFIAGTPNLRGACLGWLAEEAGIVGAERFPLAVGGPLAVAPAGLGAALMPTRDGTGWVRVTAVGASLTAQVGALPRGEAANWVAARGDGRNSGACPLSEPGSTGIAGPVALPRGVLSVSPNPAAGRLRVAWRGIPANGPRRLEVYDLRGRRVRRLAAGDLAETGVLAWDARGDDGRPVAAGAYLVVLTHPGGVLRGRAVVAR